MFVLIALVMMTVLLGFYLCARGVWIVETNLFK
jgi:hypothetical protein